jgi:hypothetical protein
MESVIANITKVSGPVTAKTAKVSIIGKFMFTLLSWANNYYFPDCLSREKIIIFWIFENGGRNRYFPGIYYFLGICYFLGIYYFLGI